MVQHVHFMPQKLCKKYSSNGRAAAALRTTLMTYCERQPLLIPTVLVMTVDNIIFRAVKLRLDWIEMGF